MSERPEHAADTDRLIGDRYRLGEVIGRGGMATIYRAHDTRLDRVVAVKILRPEISADRDLADRFRREALAATVLRHPNIVQCLDTGADAAGPYMVMDLIEGEDLAARLRRDGAMLPGDVARIALDVARGLGVAHVRGIVHRDVKPGNILLARDGRAMITDFGIARLAADAEAALPGTTLGSVQYFSPEQAQGASTTPASDVYGLGLVMYEALTGRRPWTGDTPSQIALARVGARAPSPRDARSEVPRSLDAIVVRALAPDPADRYQSGAALAEVLGPLARSVEPSAGSSAAASAAARSTTSGRTRVTRPPVMATRRSSGARALVFGVVAVLVLSGMALAVLPALGDDGRSSDGTEPPTDAAAITTEPTTRPTAGPTPTPTAEPTPQRTPRITANAGTVCDPILDVACRLGADRYALADFSPPVEFDLGDGWSTAVKRDDLVVLTRPEGLLTFAGDIGPVDGLPKRGLGNGKAKAVIAAFAGMDGVTATKPANVRIDGHRGRSVDLKPSGRRRALFATSDRSYYAEAGRTTRIVALDAAGGTLILVIEPAKGHTLRQILDTADDVATTLTFR